MFSFFLQLFVEMVNDALVAVLNLRQLELRKCFYVYVCCTPNTY